MAMFTPYGTLTREHAGKHRDILLGEDLRAMAPAAAPKALSWWMRSHPAA